MKKAKIVTAALSVFFILLTAAVKLFEENSEYSFLAGNLNGDGLIGVCLICSCICLAVSAIAAFFPIREKHIIITTVIRIVIIAGILYYTLFLSFFAADNKYYTFNSPDGKYSVIAEEWAFLLGGGVNFYERKNAFLVTEKGSIGTDDGYRVISAENYSVEWNDNVMTFTGNNGNNMYESVEIELSKQ